MSTEKTLSVQKRDQFGKGPNRRLRTSKMVPGVFYSAEGTNIAVQVSELPLQKMYDKMGRTTVFSLEIEDNGKKSTHPVMIWDVQRHPYKNQFTHIDFYGVDLDKEVKVTVAIDFVGTPKGVKLGGKLETYRERLLLLGKPSDIPKKITLDVSEMDLNASVRVADIELPSGVQAQYDQNFAVVSVVSKSAEVETDEEGGAEAAESSAAAE